MFLSHHKADFYIALTLSMKANNDTLHQPSAPSRPAKPKTEEPASISNISGDDMGSFMELERVRRALYHKISPKNEAIYKPGDKVLM